MESKAKLLGHPIHQMLVVVPLGLFLTAAIFDLIFLIAAVDALSSAAFWMILAGVIGALIAAPLGVIDWMALPEGSRAKRIGVHHGVGNVIVVLLFLLSWLMRPDIGQAATLAYVLSFAGAGLVLVTGWLGGELVDRLGVGVYDNANVDASSSLRIGKEP